MTKIFQPRADVLATSPPLWSPDGSRLLFTTARAADGTRAVSPDLFRLGREQQPHGNVHLQRPILYTCWLRDVAKDAVPVRLFDAACGHVGYVAAGLAVRWHPDGTRVVHVRQTAEHRHGLFEYDLTAKKSRRVVPLTAEAILFDWAPDSRNLVCVTGGVTEPGRSDGIRIGVPGEGECWWVPGSENLATTDLPSTLERLRATRPAWSADGKRFAFISYRPAPAQDKPGRWSLHDATLATREVRVVAEESVPLRDLHWSPDGRLGLVRDGEKPTLHILDADGALSRPLNRHPVRRFAGWSGRGEHLAYVGPGPQPAGAGEEWALMFQPDPEARDAVFVADGTTGSPEREAFSGLQATFPRWSPTEERLSVWFTFSPAYRSVLTSWLSSYLRLGVRRGDPAATFDPCTGVIGWMAVNADEKRQVGHYHLLKREYARAWKWYEDANREAGDRKEQPPETVTEYLERIGSPRDFRVFEAICLMNLDRPAEARARLDAVARDFPSMPEKDGLIALLEGNGPRVRDLLAEVTSPTNLIGSLLRDQYVAEAFLSVDAVTDGERYFAEQMAAADGDGQKLSKALMLSQFLLLSKKYEAYADLAVDVIGPLVLKRQRPLPTQHANLRDWMVSAPEWTRLLAGGAAVYPLADPEFLAVLPVEKVRRVRECARELRPSAQDDATRSAIDLILWAAAGRLGLERERKEVEGRLLTGAINPDEVAKEMRERRRALRESFRVP